MKFIKKLFVIIGIIGALVVGAAGCGEVVKTGQATQALWYEDGDFSAQHFKGCVTSAQRDRKGIGDKFYYYPSGQRTYSFTGLPGSERGPITITTQDSQQMTVAGFVTFDLTTDCTTLRKFHEQIGLKYRAYFDEGSNDSAGWSKFLNDYVDVPLNVVMSNAALDYNWQPLFADSKTLTSFDQEVSKNISNQIDQAIGIPGVIKVRDVNVQKPQPSKELLETIQQVQKAKAQGQADREKVDQERQTQQEKTKLEQDKLKTRQQCLKVYSEQYCFFLELQGGPNPPQYYPIPQGGSVIANPGGNK
jgi:hypothetical protein